MTSDGFMCDSLSDFLKLSEQTNTPLFYDRESRIASVYVRPRLLKYEVQNDEEVQKIKNRGAVVGRDLKLYEPW